MMETDFRSVLAADATVAGLVAMRIYPATYPQAAIDPCVRYAKITGLIGMHTQGSDGLQDATIQVDVRAMNAADVLAVRDAIVARLHAFAGVQGDTDFRLIELQSDRGLLFDDTGPKSYYTTSIDFTVLSRVAA